MSQKVLYVVNLELSEDTDSQKKYMKNHMEWIQTGFERGIFLAVGSLISKKGGMILVNGISHFDLEGFIKQDPFVMHGLVSATITEMKLISVDQRLEFLLP